MTELKLRASSRTGSMRSLPSGVQLSSLKGVS